MIFLELVKGLGASPSHLGLDLLFENRLRRNKICQKKHENDRKFFFLELVKVFFSKRVICVKNGTFENAKVHLLPIVEHQKHGNEK